MNTDPRFSTEFVKNFLCGLCEKRNMENLDCAIASLESYFFFI